MFLHVLDGFLTCLIQAEFFLTCFIGPTISVTCLSLYIWPPDVFLKSGVSCRSVYKGVVHSLCRFGCDVRCGRVYEGVVHSLQGVTLNLEWMASFLKPSVVFLESRAGSDSNLRPRCFLYVVRTSPGFQNSGTSFISSVERPLGGY